MDRTSDESTAADAQHSGFYLPATPRLSDAPGRVERFLTRLFRRRGGLRVVVR